MFIIFNKIGEFSFLVLRFQMRLNVNRIRVLSFGVLKFGFFTGV